MSRVLRLLPLPVLAALLLVATAVASLPGEIEMAIRGGDLGGATVAVSVREAGPGTPIVEIDPERLMLPASNLKLITTGAALHALGGDFRFETKLVRDGDRLIVVGDGDPAFGDPVLLAHMTGIASEDSRGLDAESFLGLWVRAVVESGMKRVAEIVIDDRIFDREFVHPSWPRDQLNRRYCAEVSGLSFHLNVLHFFPEPREGKRPDLTNYTPRVSALEIRNSATSRQGVHDNDTIWIARRQDTNELTFYGNVKHAYRTPVPVTIHDPPALFGVIFADRLRQAGLEVGRSRVAEPNEHAPDGMVIGPVIHTPIRTVVSRCNRDSQNLYAECLLKRIGYAMTGQPGSWLNGAAIARHIVHHRLDDAPLSSRLRIADGSGLSRENRVAPATITAWLNTFHNDDRLGEIFVESLAVGGESGTLEHRLGPDVVSTATVQAKSGYIDGVSCLSGFVTTPDGRRRCFSVMINDLDVPVSRAKLTQDRIVALIAEDTLTAAPVQMGSD